MIQYLRRFSLYCPVFYRNIFKSCHLISFCRYERLPYASCPVFQISLKQILSFLQIYRKSCIFWQHPLLYHASGRYRHLRRKYIAPAKLLCPPHGLPGGKLPGRFSVFQKQNVLTVFCNIFCMMLDHDNRFMIRLVPRLQHFINLFRMGRVKLGDGFVQNKDIRT